MARPHRPNPYQGDRTRTRNGARVPEAQRPWLNTHVPQETRAEARARKRREAEERNARTLPENRRAARRMKAAA